MIAPDQTSRSQTKSSETDGIACRNNLGGLHDFVAEYPTLGLEQSVWPRDPREGEADQICNAGAERLVSRARVQHGRGATFFLLIHAASPRCGRSRYSTAPKMRHLTMVADGDEDGEKDRADELEKAAETRKVPAIARGA